VAFHAAHRATLIADYRARNGLPGDAVLGGLVLPAIVGAALFSGGDTPAPDRHLYGNTKQGEALYAEARHAHRRRGLYVSTLAEHYGLTDADIEAANGSENARELARGWRDLANESVTRRSHLEHRPPPTAEELAEAARIEAERASELAARDRVRDRKRASRAKQDPRKGRLSAAKVNLRKALASAERIADEVAAATAEVAACTTPGARAWAEDRLRLAKRAAYLNQQAQARWRAEIETNQAP
jgi:hypothetical protein